MTLPIRHHPGRLSVGEPIATDLDDLFQQMGHLLESAAAMPTVATRRAWAPLAEIRDTDDAYILEVELPGIEREDIDVEINGRELRITGEYKEREAKGTL